MNYYEITKTTELKELNATLTELIHKGSGAKVVHIKNDDTENLFCLSFKTLPQTSNGVAHILEHTVLCGSERFPIKDPFFGMTRRSLNTFMNAMTGSDFTCYPASSQVEKDFYNLLDVYIDAVFFPKLHPNSLLQEGIRLEYSIPNDPTSPLEYKGIVFNEMKGALSSGTARLSELMNEALYPDITYGINSGGDPKEIPNLTYEDLTAFHKKFYHPSQCLFYFYGDIPLVKHLTYIHEKVLKDVEPTPPIEEVGRQSRFDAPKYIEAAYPVPPGTNQEDKTLISFGWVTSYIKDTIDTIGMTVLSLVLMDNDASVLKQAILKSGLCKQASAFIDTEMTEAPFVLTIRGAEAKDADALEKVIFDTFNQVVNEGIPQERIDSVIHQLELSRSEITGDSHPYGLSLYLRSALLAHHGVEVEEGLLVHKVFDALRDRIKTQPDYLLSLIDKHFIKNTHRARVIMHPSETLGEEEVAQEKAILKKIAEKLSPEGQQKLVKQAAELTLFQNEQEDQDIDILPKVTLEDVPKEEKHFPLETVELENFSVYSHSTFTNEIVYADVIYDLPEYEEKELPYLRLLATILPQMGSGGKSYIETLNAIQEYTGGIGTALSFNLQAKDAITFTPSIHVRGKALYRNKEKMFELMRGVIADIDWTDEVRFKEILDKHVTGLVGSIQHNALRYAMNLSASGLSAYAKLGNIWYGIDYVDFIKKLSEDSSGTLDILKKIYEKAVNFARPTLVITADEHFIKEAVEQKFWSLSSLKSGINHITPWNIPFSPIESEGKIISSQVAFTSKSLRTVPFAHPDSPALQVISHLFDNLTLHTKIREQGGAYGGGASCSGSAATLSFYAYRDPHLSQTLKAFDAAIETVVAGDFDDEDLDEAKLEIIQGLDSPVAPGSRGEVSYGWLKDGKTPELLQKYREKVLSITKSDVINVVKNVIVPRYEEAPVVVFAGKGLLEKENKLLEKPLKLSLAD